MSNSNTSVSKVALVPFLRVISALGVCVNIGVIISGIYANTTQLPSFLSSDSFLQTEIVDGGLHIKRVVYVAVFTAIIAIVLGNFWAVCAAQWQQRQPYLAAGISAAATTIIQVIAFAVILWDVNELNGICDGLSRCTLVGCDAGGWDAARSACRRWPAASRAAAALSIISAAAQLAMAIACIYTSRYMTEEAAIPATATQPIDEGKTRLKADETAAAQGDVAANGASDATAANEEQDRVAAV